jgi:ribonuclease R
MKEGNQQKLRKNIEKLFAANRNKAYNYKQLAAQLDITSGEAKESIIRILKSLEKEGIIEEIAPGKFTALYVAQFKEGRLDMTQRGAGFVVPDEGGVDVYIGPEHLNTALNGDRVKINLFAARANDRISGEIVEVVKRNKMEFVGVVQVSHNYAFLVPDDKKMYADIYIPLNKLNRAKNGDKAIARITSWSIEDKNPFGEITEILGKPGDHQTEMHAIIAEFGFSVKFPEEVEQEAEQISVVINKEEIAKRKDFRKVLTFTIDPEDAKDFDDAISFQIIKDGVYEVGVHIADVSHYVRPGTKLDEEALRRATSVYLVDRTIPMLPEKLSNGVCSLRPNEEKLTFSAVFQINDNCDILNHWLGKTVIYSDRRFAYEEAQERIESGKGDLAQEIIILNNIAKKLRERRFKNGAVNFETEEVKFKLDENFKPIGLFKKIRKDAHKLIEEYMLLANRTVAEDVFNMGKGDKKKTFVYRVHEQPSDEKLKLFSMFANRFGYRIITTSQRAISQSFNDLLLEVEGKPEQNIIQSMAVRSMMKAYYTIKKTGHYGLAFDYYSHFTSPIRRYPDLMAHRLLFSYLNKGKSANETEYEAMCKQSSAMEVQAADAERASVRYKQVEYIKDFIGQEFPGIISGVTEWGMFVEITEYKCEGLVRVSNLADDFYEFDEVNQWIIGKRTHKKYQLGDQVQVIVKGADTVKRQVDLDLVGNAEIVRIQKSMKRQDRRKEKDRGERGAKKGKGGDGRSSGGGNKKKRR